MSDIWNRFFNGYSYTDHTSNSIIHDSSGNYHVNHVFFTNLNSQIIRFFGNDDSKLLISFCVFDSNNVHVRNGNIYQEKGQCVQYRICSYISTTNNYEYPHSYIRTTNNQEYKNYLIESTITLSDGKTGPIYQRWGGIKIENVNISYSEASTHYSVYFIYGVTRITASNSYSTFFNNTAKEYSCLYNYYSLTYINYCNILSNQCSKTFKDDNGIIHAFNRAVVTIEHCVISNNNGYNLFYAKNDCSIKVISCFIPSNDVIISANGQLSTSAIVDSLQFVNEHFNTILCYAPNPIKSITILLIELERTEYYYKADKYIKLSGNVRCEADSFTIYCQIEGQMINFLGDALILSENKYHANNNTYSFTANYELPDSLKEPNIYNLTIHAETNSEDSNVIYREFQFKRNTPKIEIIKQPTFPVYLNKTRIMKFILSVTDQDGEGNVTINHVLNNIGGKEPINIQINNQTDHHVPYDVSIPENFDVGNYNLRFTATDEHNLVSDINITVTFANMPTENINIVTFHKFYKR
ncbi:hypothetical protein TVAG_151760 [Trichomonas vaginalis G3]|uniref:Uncharacterized protein n=1 Tax=Trichomonas vaginalis (strain ATCC PRA-98 / G3) TaxID=412133 RepID=A2ELU1_TRIV3|nr:hypothetical protein TVAGG3_0401010 [Trichomonas vaginalis G3]EAY06369.1 hypothetical protein TVAG_151760 [Trichomonas vaginalis G3]KAI5534691.1 hypothetical protein TVAGG3_0401010 [Trichomonas vaginalis G3]|eukprot:XP_001318592.1 hypothetical protein [Trichomonas vaginalis G3]